ncbi:autotransporter assembly complex protein TamA [Azospirillum sp.]|uniref:autotransporter assembly complex protein TamA n=1 Tax=Azospirillum sp. TaxID=34012 RepID=UPI003D74260F
MTRARFPTASALALALLLAPLPAFAQEEVSKVPYEVDLTGLEGDDALRTLLRESSSLFELKDDPPPSVIGLERRADADRDRLDTALRSAGHYDARLDIRVDPSVQPARVTIAVEPGPAYRFKAIAVRTGSGAPLPGPAVTADELGLKPGEPARAPQVVDAQSKLVSTLAGRGYAFAKVTDRRAVVDHSDRTMDVTFVVDPGPLARFGSTRIEGLEQVDADLVRGRLPWAPGATYQPALIERARTDIAKLGVFDTVRVQLADQPGPDGTTPVTVAVTERKRHVLGAGVVYSTTDGLGGNVYWGHRNLFGGAEQLRLSLEVGRLTGDSSSTSKLDLPDLRFGVNFRKPDFLAPRQSLVLDFSVVTDNPPAYERVAGLLTAVIEREISDALKVSAGLTSERGRVRTAERTYQVSLLGAPLGVTYDGTDNLLNPTKGYRLAGTLTPWFPVGGNESTERFLAGTVTGSAYYDVVGDGRYVAAARVGLGSIVGAPLASIPPDRRFYAGGGGSVRGYGFQKAGPRNFANDPTGGRSLVELGVEMRVKITDTIGLVPFVDAGTVSDRSVPGLNGPLRVGTGLGLRYYTDFGPLRVDVGVPLNPERGDSRWQLYLSLGQAF